jgi:hypothetical protein
VSILHANGCASRARTISPCAKSTARTTAGSCAAGHAVRRARSGEKSFKHLIFEFFRARRRAWLNVGKSKNRGREGRVCLLWPQPHVCQAVAVRGRQHGQDA